MIERVIRSLKEQCIPRHRLESLQHASRVIGDWISFKAAGHGRVPLLGKSRAT